MSTTETQIIATGSGISRAPSDARAIDALIEILVGLGLICLIDWFWFPNSFGFLDQPLHPYFIIVLLAAGRYGTQIGVIAGLLASALYMIALYGPVPLDDLSSFFHAGQLMLPYLFLTMGVVMGELRQMVEDEKRTLTRKVALLQGKLDSASGECDALQKVSHELKERIAASTETVGSFYEAAGRVETLDPQALPEALLEIVERFCGATSVALYVAGSDDGSAGDFTLERVRGVPMGGNVLHSLDASSSWVQAVHRTQQVVAAHELVNPDAGAAPYILAAPLHGGEVDTRVTHILAILRIPFDRLSVSTRFSLWTIAEWASKVLRNAHSFELAQNAAPTDRLSGVLKHEHFQITVDREWARSRRYDIPLSLVYLSIDGLQALPIELQHEGMKSMGKLLYRTLRLVDIVGLLPVAGGFGVLLPSTPELAVYRVVARIQEAATAAFGTRGQLAGLKLRFGLGFFEKGQESVREMTDRAAQFSLRRSVDSGSSSDPKGSQ